MTCKSGDLSKPPDIAEYLIYPMERFADSFGERLREGAKLLANVPITFVGLARNCESHLRENLWRLEHITQKSPAWRLHIETNDNTDGTASVLAAFCEKHRQASFREQTLKRRHYTTEFSGPRTIALAEYRTACQRWVGDHAADSAFTVVIDWDAWGGWSFAGFLNGLGWMLEMPGAFGMASVSLLQTWVQSNKGTGIDWMHYDAWALRLNSGWDDYTAGVGGWKHLWVPPIGSDPVKVVSAFGGLCIYRTEAFLQGTYDGTKDCEHVPFHETIAKATGQHLYINPSQRCIMNWVTDGGRDGDN